MKTNLLFLHALSPLHAGTGQGIGAIDLPIAREKATNLPIVPGSTLKGVLRANCQDDGTKLCERVFGPETNNAGEHAGSAQFSDLRLLFLPVRSMAGTFAWVTSPLVLWRFARDCEMANTLVFGEPPRVDDNKTCLLAADPSALTMKIEQQDNQVVLEDLRLTGSLSETLQNLVNGLAIHLFKNSEWQTLFKQRVCVVHDDVLNFLLETATEITARIGIEKDKKTVAEGALWYEEALPAESILAGLVTVQEIKASADEVRQVIGQIAQDPLQVGGNSTVGRGLCRIYLAVGG